MKSFVLKKLIPLSCSLIAVLWIVMGFLNYGFWTMDGPGPGFFPVLVAAVLLLVSVLMLMEEGGKIPAFHKDSFMLIGGIVAAFAASFVIGVFVSLMLFTFLWVRVYEKSSWKTTLQILATVGVLVYGVFIAWLGIAFPVGIVFELMGF